MPVLKRNGEILWFKMNFAFINLDDTQDQFVKTSKAMFMEFKETIIMQRVV